MGSLLNKNVQTLGGIVTAIFLFMIPSGAFSAEDKTDVPVPGGELIVSLYASPPHLNPAIGSGLATAFPGAQIFAGLLRNHLKVSMHGPRRSPAGILTPHWTMCSTGVTR